MVSSFGGAAPLMLGISFAETAVATFLVLLRLCAASMHAGKMRWDFFWVALSTALGIVCQGLLVPACFNGIGNHFVDVTYPDLWQGLKFTWIGLMVGVAAVTTAKLGIFALLLQVTTPAQPGRRVLLWVFAVIYVMINVAQIGISLTQCSPTDKLWYKLLPGKCDRAILANNFGMFQGAAAVFTDLFLALYPTTIVWDLQISHRAKIGFCVLMAGGLIPAAAGIMRTIYLPRLVTSVDPTYELSPFITWAVTEVWFVIILGSIPPLRPLFERVFHKARIATRGETTDVQNMSVTNAVTLKTIGSRKMGRFSKTQDAMVSVVDDDYECEV